MHIIKHFPQNAVLKGIILLIIVSCNHNYIWGQQYVFIYTPQGSEVIAEYEPIDEVTEAEKEALKQHVTQKYPKAEYLDEATSTYNCHNYAWNMVEGGGKFWMNNPIAYMTDVVMSKPIALPKRQPKYITTMAIGTLILP